MTVKPYCKLNCSPSLSRAMSLFLYDASNGSLYLTITWPSIISGVLGIIRGGDFLKLLDSSGCATDRPSENRGERVVVRQTARITKVMLCRVILVILTFL